MILKPQGKAGIILYSGYLCLLRLKIKKTVSNLFSIGYNPQLMRQIRGIRPQIQ
jgi:hypothetical protein